MKLRSKSSTRCLQWRSVKERGREGERESTGVTMEPLQCKCSGITGTTHNSKGRHILLHRFQCNSYPRLWHVEPDAQVTLGALCLLHNAPAQYHGRVRRNGWFSDWISKNNKHAARILLLADACEAKHLKRNAMLFINTHGYDGETNVRQ